MAITKLQKSRPVIRRTDSYDRTDPIIVELHPTYLAIRATGEGQTFELSYKEVLDLARKLRRAVRRAS